MNIFGDVRDPCKKLAARDEALALALTEIGAPHIRRRDGGFPGLFRIIIEQQVSVPSAQAILGRCVAGIDPLTADMVLVTKEEGLRALGLSGPKARYAMALADQFATGELSAQKIKAISDDVEASKHLQEIKGIGPWTAAIYLLFCEGRIDLWPPGDVALQHAFGKAAGMDEKPSARELDERSEGWAPYRGLAAHILWTYYAKTRGRKPI